MEQTALFGKVLELEKFRLIRKLRASGLECIEDDHGKFKIWLRLSDKTNSLGHNSHSDASVSTTALSGQILRMEHKNKAPLDCEGNTK